MFSVNLQRIANSNAPAVVRLLAHQLQQKPYMLVGDFLGSISDSDLNILLQVVEDSRDENYGRPGYIEAVESVMVLTVMLVNAEGGSVETEAEVSSMTGALALFICLESMARKGAIDLAREKMSFLDVDAEIAVVRGS
jgi:hypothetical protein